MPEQLDSGNFKMELENFKVAEDTKIEVQSSKIYPKNFRCGDVIEDSDGNQYTITDSIRDNTTLRRLKKDERIESEFLDGSLDIQAF